MQSNVIIKLATSIEERRAAYQLRYRVYVEEMGFAQRHVDHEARMVQDSLDVWAVLLVASLGGTTVGTVRSNFGVDGDFGEFASLHQMRKLGCPGTGPASMTSKMIIAPEWRCRRLSLRLAQTMFRIGLRRRVAVDFIDCDQPLIPFYTRLGYVLNAEMPFEHPELGPRWSLRLRLDTKQLASQGSPLVRGYSEAEACTLPA